MRDVPVRRLGDVLKKRRDRALGDEQLLSVTATRGVVRQSEAGRRDISSENKSNYRRVKPGDIIYNTMRMWQGVSGHSAYDGIVSPAYTVCSPTADADSAFLAHLLKLPKLVQKFENYSQGLVSDTWNLKYSAFSKITAPIPPLDEQRKIAEILDTADESIRSTERLIAKLAQLKSGVLNFALDPPSESDWQHGPAEKFCTKISVGVVNRATEAYRSSGVPFLRSQNIRPNKIDLQDLLFVTSIFNRIQQKSILRTDDVAIVRTGYPGTAAVIPKQLDGANCFSLVIARTSSELDPHFLALYMNSPAGKQDVARTQFGSAQHNFNVGEMRKLRIPVPPLERQQEILALATAHDMRIDRERDTLEKLRKAKQGLMEDLLTGRVRVEVD